jgi:hypothetical protein
VPLLKQVSPKERQFLIWRDLPSGEWIKNMRMRRESFGGEQVTGGDR